MNSPRAFNKAGTLFCDLTQSWSEMGGGVRTYLLHKRSHILERTGDRHLLVIPGRRDEIIEEGRATTIMLKSPRVPGSPNYRLLLRNGAVREALERFRPDLIECQDAYNLPWAAIGHRKRHLETALVAAYMTDFPTVYIERPLGRFIGKPLASRLARLAYSYGGALYRRFDVVFALSENGGASKLRSQGVDHLQIVPLGVELGGFGPSRRDPKLRAELELAEHQPLLIYVGRLDSEKRPEVVVDAFQRLPAELGAKLVLVGDGPYRAEVEALNDPRIRTPGFVRDRSELARWLATADIYVSGMRDETFGVSIVEAQASGLPVVGVAAGAMVDRVNDQTGRLGPIDDGEAMAANIMEVWNGDRDVMRSAAQQMGQMFSWDATMEALFSRVYPLALARRQTAVEGLQGAAKMARSAAAVR